MSKHKITLRQIEEAHNFTSYEEEFAFISEKMKKGTLQPCGKKNNGKKPSLPAVLWRIQKETIKENTYQDELLSGLPSAIDPSYYIRHKEDYDQERHLVQQLASYIINHAKDLCTPYSEKQRSFAIWQREKGFEKGLLRKDGKLIGAERLLSHCGLSSAFLNVYHTYEPFPFYSAVTTVPQNILIVENDDPYSNITARMMRGTSTLFGTPIGTVMLFQDDCQTSDPAIFRHGQTNGDTAHHCFGSKRRRCKRTF